MNSLLTVVAQAATVGALAGTPRNFPDAALLCRVSVCSNRNVSVGAVVYSQTQSEFHTIEIDSTRDTHTCRSRSHSLCDD